MSIAALRPPAAIYREEQNFGWWVYALLAVLMVLGVWGLKTRQGRGHALDGAMPRWAVELPLGVAVGLALPPILVVGVLRMTTEVAPGGCRVWFGWVPTYRRSIPLDGVRLIEVVEFRPWRDYWGPGVRSGRDGERVFFARGRKGVRIQLADGSKYLIGSQNPAALATALERATRAAV